MNKKSKLILTTFVFFFSMVSIGIHSGGDVAYQGFFYPYETFPVGSYPEAVAIGDVNNDGLNDVVMTTSYYFDPENDYHIFVFLQNTSGNLDAPVKYPAGNGKSIDIGDLNKDGKADVAVTTDTGIGIFLQNSSGGLDPMVPYATSNTEKLRIGDFNDDKRLDVASIGWDQSTVDVFLQNTSGTLDPPDTYTALYGGYNDLEVGDVNNDGLTDIIVMSGQSYEYDNIGVLLQNTGGTFDPVVYYDVGGDVNTHGVGVGDINNDTLEDVVVSFGGNTPTAFIGTFLQNISGTLDPAIYYSSYDIPEPVEIGDVNLDGKNDVIVAHGGWNAMGVFLQTNDGSLLPYELYPIPYASHYNPHGLDVGDFNGDGVNDVAIADYNNGLVVLYHTPPPDLPEPDIKANGSDGPITIKTTDILSITIKLDAGLHEGANVDWWLLAKTPYGWYYYNTTYGWLPGIHVTYQGPLSDQPSTEVSNMSGLPVGSYTGYFGVDFGMNGEIDMDHLYYDMVIVTINP